MESRECPDSVQYNNIKQDLHNILERLQEHVDKNFVKLIEERKKNLQL